MSVEYAYAVLRLVPDVERGERLNVGVALFSRRGRFLGLRTALDEDRVRAVAPEADLGALREHLGCLERIAAGDPSAGPIAALEPSDRFGWLVAPSSTIVQPGETHTGLCEDPAATLDRLLRRLV